jgi:hypothetical protein
MQPGGAAGDDTGCCLLAIVQKSGDVARHGGDDDADISCRTSIRHNPPGSTHSHWMEIYGSQQAEWPARPRLIQC